MAKFRLCAGVFVAGLAVLTGCGDPGPGGGAGAGDGAAGAAADTAGGRGVAEICDTITNSFRCARAVERRRLPSASGAGRRGDTLFLALETGDTTRLVDFSGDHSDVIHYSYQDHWAEAGQFVVHKQYYEGSQHVLVDDSAGTRTALPDRPIPAPGGTRFAVLSLDLVAGYGPNVLQVWTLADGSPRRVWETEPSQWGPTDGRWLDSTTLRFTQHGYCDQLGGTTRAMCDRFATLRKAGGDWHLEIGAPDDGG